MIAQSDGKKLLCGTINAKNSYGGYVGAKNFYVRWADGTPSAPEVYIDGDVMARAQVRIDELAAVARDRSSGLSAQIRAASEGDSVLAQARKDLARSTQILTDRCTRSAISVDDK